MDQERFDHVARGLASGITRRGLVGNLTGAVIGGVLVAVGASEAGARKRKRKRGGNRRDVANLAAWRYLTGYTGCTSFAAEYWSALNPGGFRAQNRGNVTLGPTDLSGSSQTSLGTFVEGGYLDIRINGVATDWTPVEC